MKRFRGIMFFMRIISMLARWRICILGRLLVFLSVVGELPDPIIFPFHCNLIKTSDDFTLSHRKVSIREPTSSHFSINVKSPTEILYFFLLLNFNGPFSIHAQNMHSLYMHFLGHAMFKQYNFSYILF